MDPADHTPGRGVLEDAEILQRCEETYSSIPSAPCESLEHALAHCLIARLVWRHAIHAWSQSSPLEIQGTGWARDIFDPDRPTLTIATIRAMVLGVRPEGQQSRSEPFGLLRGIIVDTLLQWWRSAAAEARERGEHKASRDIYRAAARLYEKVRVAYDEACVPFLAEQMNPRIRRTPPGKLETHLDQTRRLDVLPLGNWKLT